MLTIADLDLTSRRLTDFFRINQFNLNDSMIRVSSGKRLTQPSDGSADYFRVKKMNADIRGLEQVQRDISVGNALLDVAKAVGASVFEDLTRMQELLKFYHDPATTSDEKTAYAAEFNATKNRIASDIDNAYYDKWKLVADNGSKPLMRIIMDPRDVSVTYDINYTADDVTDVSGLTIGAGDQATEQAALQAQLDRAASYLGKSTVYSDALATHHALAAKKCVNYCQSAESTEKIDDGAEMMSLVKRSLHQQMTVSMMAQANIFTSAIAALVRNEK